MDIERHGNANAPTSLRLTNDESAHADRILAGLRIRLAASRNSGRRLGNAGRLKALC
jgi:hypothetical protein